MRVVIIGAGIGGLVLARALRDEGVRVRVYERDAALADTGGYRLHLAPEACAALRRRVPAALYQALLASASGAASFRRFSVFDHRLRRLLSLPRNSPGDHLLIGRIPLRRLLAHDLDDVLDLDSHFIGHTRSAGGTVTAHFADGRTAMADVLVGADGARSRVVTEISGRPGARTLDAWGIAGRTPLTDESRALLPAELDSGPGFVVGPRGTAVFLSVHDPAVAPVSPRSCREIPAVAEPGYVLWGLVTSARRTAESNAVDTALALLPGWSPRLVSLISRSEPAEVTTFPYLAADPHETMTPWPADNVTAIGDAIHAMPPTGGRGATTAILDADLLATLLSEAHHDKSTPALAIHDFHRQLPGYALPALRQSLQPLRWQRAAARSPLFAVTRAALGAVGSWQGLRQRVRPDAIHRASG
ncbi:FAD-dependent oxidoreductase [Nocardia sp. NPDC006044]|uniref:FAD-dependent oxidoreductase n=1 Tax=Nocardia sp. NPDC006044 TaxID=3364306 RepID=UPI0036CCE859